MAESMKNAAKTLDHESDKGLKSYPGSRGEQCSVAQLEINETIKRKATVFQ